MNLLRGMCWKPGCEEKFRQEIRVKFKTKKDNTLTYELKACDGHFAEAMETEYIPLVTQQVAQLRRTT